MSNPAGYRKDIQGLRAIAVVSVLLFHAFPEHVSGGFVGVDIFFVISGFLISSILYRDMQTGRYSLAEFYRKRIRRLFPALFVILIVTLSVGFAVLPATEYRELARNAVSSTLFLSNVDFYLLSGYFSRMAELKPLLHTWSLAVEEQFYIAFPPLLWLVHRYAQRFLIPFVLLVFGFSLLLAQVMLPRDPALVFYLSPFRGFEILAGVLVALIALPSIFSSRTARDIFTTLGLLMTLAAVMTYSPEMQFPGAVALLPTIGTALVLLAGRGGGSHAGRLISLPPFMFFGAISYSLYLWHWPILSYLRILTPTETPPLPMTVGATALAILTGALSYQFVEKPFMYRDIRSAPFLRAGLAGMIVICGIALGIRLADGLPARFSPEVTHLFAGSQDYSPERKRCHRMSGELAYDRTCVIGTLGVEPNLIIFGDSHGVELAYALAERLTPIGRSLRPITSSQCPPLLGPAFDECGAFNQRMLSAIAADPAVDTVILAMNAEAHLEKYDLDTLKAGYAAVLDLLGKADKKVFVITQIPNINLDAPSAAGYARLRGTDPTLIGRQRTGLEETTARWSATQTALAEAHGFIVFDPIPSLCTPTLCPIVDEAGNVLYFNPTHISVAGARHLANDLLPLL